MATCFFSPGWMSPSNVGVVNSFTSAGVPDNTTATPRATPGPLLDTSTRTTTFSPPSRIWFRFSSSNEARKLSPGASAPPFTPGPAPPAGFPAASISWRICSRPALSYASSLPAEKTWACRVRQRGLYFPWQCRLVNSISPTWPAWRSTTRRGCSSTARIRWPGMS